MSRSAGAGRRIAAGAAAAIGFGGDPAGDGCGEPTGESGVEGLLGVWGARLSSLALIQQGSDSQSAHVFSRFLLLDLALLFFPS